MIFSHSRFSIWQFSGHVWLKWWAHAKRELRTKAEWWKLCRLKVDIFDNFCYVLFVVNEIVILSENSMPEWSGTSPGQEKESGRIWVTNRPTNRPISSTLLHYSALAMMWRSITHAIVKLVFWLKLFHSKVQVPGNIHCRGVIHSQIPCTLSRKHPGLPISLRGPCSCCYRNHHW